MKFFQQLGKSMMLPVACLPICGLLMGLGYLICPNAMQGGEISGFIGCTGYFLVCAGGALINHIALLFAIGVGVGMAEDNDGAAAISALVSWLILITLLNPNTVTVLLPNIAGNSTYLMAFEKIENPFIGILSGLIGAFCYNKFHKTKLPAWLAFFSGKRSTVIVSGLVSLVASFILLFLWPLLFSGLTALGMTIAKLGPVGAGLYAFLNRLLIPFGLHHALNNVFWFDTIGLGDLSHFWAGETSADVSWSLGMYMSGFFPCMMFGVPAAIFAMIRSAKPDRRKAAAAILLSSALCSFVCGVTEPFEFSFMFLCPPLYVVYALLYGIVTFITVVSGFRAGFCFSGGVTDLIFSSSMPASAKTWLIIPLGLLAFVLFYLVFRIMITKLNLKTPGREDNEENEENTDGNQNNSSASSTGKEDKYTVMAKTILRGLGGAGNILTIDNCITRLRLEVKDPGKVNDSIIRSSGATGVMRPGKNSIQVIIGTTVQFVADEMKRLYHEPASSSIECVVADQNNADNAASNDATLKDAPSNDTTVAVSVADHESSSDEGMRIPFKEIFSPAMGKIVPMEEIPDPVFSSGDMGDCFGIIPVNDEIYAPISGSVSVVAVTGHAIGIQGNDMAVLIHVGIDTVGLNGEGFTVLVKEEEQISEGQLLMHADIDFIKSKGLNPMIIVVRLPE